MKLRLPKPVPAEQARRIASFNGTSRLFGKLADANLPKPLLQSAIKLYSRVYNVDLEQAQLGIDEFHSFGDFFARQLVPGARPMPESSHTFASPADGALLNFGKIRKGQILQVKGRPYSLADFLGSSREAARLEDGQFATIYLSPADYHRVHSPLAGKITLARYIPGALYSVSPFFVENIDRLFVNNERIVIHVETRWGPIVVVMVGAVIVGRVELAFSDLSTNRPPREATSEQYDPPVEMEQGQELGAFKMGSTVVALLPPGWSPLALREELKVKVGMPLFKRVPQV